MINGLGYGYKNIVTKSEHKFNNSVFKNAQKDVRKQEVRDADWGLAAAQSCLARDLVTAGPEEAGLIMDKLEFVSKHLNENMQVDSDISSKLSADKCEVMKVKADTKASQAEYVKALGNTATQVAGQVSKVASDVTGLIDPIKSINRMA